MDIYKANFLGTFIALMILIISNLIFVFRILDLSKTAYWAGVIFLLTSLPIMYLLFTANDFDRPTIYYIQLGIMLTFIIVELLFDYLFKINFRDTRWVLVTYVTLFFAATGGMIGVASLSGKTYSIIAIILFLIMTFLAFFSRIKTGI